jgi:ParB family chromosome partitioning protein
MALGRGLGSILSDVEEAYKKDFADSDSFDLEASGVRLEELEVESIMPNPFQPRKYFNQQALEELSESIVAHGLLQPIIVIDTADGYLLVAGERRLRAHKMAKIETIRAIVDETAIDEVKLRELALLENIQRENLNAIELATAYAELIQVHDIRHEDLAKVMNKSRSQITNTMRLLNLGAFAQEKLIEGQLTQGHAKILGGLDEATQKVIINFIIGQKLSVRETESLLKRYKNSPKTTEKTKIIPNKSKVIKSSNVKELARLLPFSHRIKDKSIEIHFLDAKDLENFLKFLQKINL